MACFDLSLIKSFRVCTNFLMKNPCNQSLFYALNCSVNPTIDFEDFMDHVIQLIVNDVSVLGSKANGIIASFVGAQNSAQDCIEPAFLKSLLGTCSNSMSLIMLIIEKCAHVHKVRFEVVLFEMRSKGQKEIVVEPEIFVRCCRILIVLNDYHTFFFPIMDEPTNLSNQLIGVDNEVGPSIKVVDRLQHRKKRVPWSLEECEALSSIMKECPTFKGKQVVDYFFQLNPQTLHH